MSEEEAKESRRLTCFVISEIGAEGSEERKRANQVLKHVIQPVAGACGYVTVRADEIAKPGLITDQIIQHVVNDDMVVADLTNNNPNVFYELAIRHAARKPAVVMASPKQRIPFDIGHVRVMTVDISDLDAAERSREDLARHLQGATSEPEASANPVAAAVDLDFFRHSRQPLEKVAVSLIERLDRMIAQLYREQVEYWEQLLHITRKWPRGLAAGPVPVEPEFGDAVERFLVQQAERAKQFIPRRTDPESTGSA